MVVPSDQHPDDQPCLRSCLSGDHRLAQNESLPSCFHSFTGFALDLPVSPAWFGHGYSFSDQHWRHRFIWRHDQTILGPRTSLFGRDRIHPKKRRRRIQLSVQSRCQYVLHGFFLIRIFSEIEVVLFHDCHFDFFQPNLQRSSLPFRCSWWRHSWNFDGNSWLKGGDANCELDQ